LGRQAWKQRVTGRSDKLVIDDNGGHRGGDGLAAAQAPAGTAGPVFHSKRLAFAHEREHAVSGSAIELEAALLEILAGGRAAHARVPFNSSELGKLIRRRTSARAWRRDRQQPGVDATITTRPFGSVSR
jgi:hypothetical protein